METTVAAVGLQVQVGMVVALEGAVVEVEALEASQAEAVVSVEAGAVDPGKVLSRFGKPAWDLEFISPIFALL